MTREEVIQAVKNFIVPEFLARSCETMRKALDDMTAATRRPGDVGDSGLFGVELDLEIDTQLDEAFRALFADASTETFALIRCTLIEVSSPLRRQQA